MKYPLLLSAQLHYFPRFLKRWYTDPIAEFIQRFQEVSLRVFVPHLRRHYIANIALLGRSYRKTSSANE